MKLFILYFLILNAFIFSLNAQCTSPINIVVLGSSTSFGTGASNTDSTYVNRYLRFLLDSVNSSCVIHNLARSGYSTYSMQPSSYKPPSKRVRFVPDTLRNITKALSLHPDAIIINFPSNDAGSFFSLKEQKDNFLRVTHLIDSAGIPFWITTTQPRNFTGDALALEKKALLSEMRNSIIEMYPDNFIDFYDGIQSKSGNILAAYNCGDNIHLNDAGHRLLFLRLKDKKIHRILCL